MANVTIPVALDMNRDIAHTDAMEPSLADQRAQVTRDAIIQAVQHLLVHEHPAAISVPAVAKVAGVSVRTIYRYFPTKAALLDGVANHFPDRSLGGDWQVLFDTRGQALRDLWTDFATNIDAVRAEHQSPAGADLRQRRLVESRVMMNKFLADLFPQAAGPDLDDLADQVIAVTSSSMFLELTDRLGHNADKATDLALACAEALLADFEAKLARNANASTSAASPGDASP